MSDQTWLRRQEVTREDADDLTQDVLTVLFQKLPRFRHAGRTGAFRCWLRTITVHRLRAYWRDRNQRPQATGDSAFLDFLQQLEDPPECVEQGMEQQHN